MSKYQLDEDGYVVVEFIPRFPVVIDEDGARVRYEPNFIRHADKLFHALFKYQADAANATGLTPAGKPYIAERRTLQIADPGVRAYKFNGSTATEPEPFENYPIIKDLRDRIVKELGVQANFCLYNIYNSDAVLGWHSDSEKDMVAGSTIVSLSFGDKRKFSMHRKDDPRDVRDFYLESGSAITMEGECQKIFKHSIRKMTKKELANVVYGYRINLTFRDMKLKDD
jgi:alkylated DNA repair dioxygenase AlkB